MTLKRIITVILLLPILALAQSDESSKKYSVDNLPDDHYGRLARYGNQLSEKTFEVIGPEVSDKKMRYSGNNLACTNCHHVNDEFQPKNLGV